MVTRFLLSALLLVVPLCAQKSYDEFARALEQSARLNDQKGYDRVIKDNPVHALSHFKGLVYSAMRDPDDLANSQSRLSMRKAWERVFQGQTLDKLERWLNLLDINSRRNHENVLAALTRGYAEIDQLTANKVQDRKPFEALRDSLMEIAQAFEQIGAGLDAAEAWGLIARVYMAMPEQTVMDRKDSVFAIARFKEHRQNWEFTTDQWYAGNINWMEAEREKIKVAEGDAERRKAEGYGDDIRGAGAFLMPNADEAEITAALEFKPLQKQKDDMFMYGGPVPMMWATVQVTNTGPAPFVWFKGCDLFMVRPGSTKFGVTLDGRETDIDKNDYTPVNAANKIKAPSRFFLDAGKKRPYAMWFFTGGGEETFQGMSQNLAPGRDFANVYYQSASSWEADVNGTKVVLYDDNSNGKLFEDDPLAFGLMDRTIGAGPDDEVPVPAFDGMQIGKAPVQPFSDWVSIDGAWYHVRGKDEGTAVGFRPVNPDYFKTGTIEVKWSGPAGMKPRTLIVTGRGDFAGARFNIAAGKPVEVPVGSYRLAYGRIAQGRGARMITANMFPGESPEIAVEEGKPAEIELGAPFRLDFTREEDEGRVVINALKIRVRGVAGELYSHVNGAVPAPVVLEAKSEDGKGAREIGEFVAVSDPEIGSRFAAKFAKLGIYVNFFPLVKGDQKGDPILKVAVRADHKVGLKEDKNKLFGKLQPIFK